MGATVAAAFALSALSAVADWVAVARSMRRVEYLLKPATLALLLAAGFLLTTLPHDTWAAPFFLFALAASLVGDICLLWPGDRLFLPGLVAFLIAHIGYVLGLNPSPPPWAALLLLVPIAAIGGWLVRSVARGLHAHGQTRLLAPVILYSLAIGMMLFSAWATLLRPEWTAPRRLTVIVGASLFFASDAMLAWDRFVTPSPSAGLWVMVTYHLAQIALTASLVLGA